MSLTTTAIEKLQQNINKLEEIINIQLETTSKNYGKGCPGYLIPSIYSREKHVEAFKRHFLRNTTYANNKVTINIADINGEIDKDMLEFKEAVLKSYCKFLKLQLTIVGGYKKPDDSISRKVFNLLG